MFPQLNLPVYTFKLKGQNQRTQIYDIVRRKYVVLTPEEWVRQHFIHFLVQEKKFPASLMAIETAVKSTQTLKRRSDIVIYDNTLNPYLLVECKAPEIKIKQDVFDQIARYNMDLKVKFLIVSNGLQHFCCEMDYEKKSYTFVKDIPMCELK
ncbi:MAG: type I restriction enzyme HsdR N-terminal domain-containing protein [Bacteroidia bacterium]